jgi:hypothetical protein
MTVLYNVQLAETAAALGSNHKVFGYELRLHRRAIGRVHESGSRSSLQLVSSQAGRYLAPKAFC